MKQLKMQWKKIWNEIVGWNIKIRPHFYDLAIKMSQDFFCRLHTFYVQKELYTQNFEDIKSIVEVLYS